MAFTERYVTQAAGGGGDGSIGTPWTLTEAVAAAVAGDRVNVKSDGAYSIGTMSPATGTISLPAVWRGYSSTIGDLDNLGRNADGTLNVTGFPAITLTGIWVIGVYNVMQNWNVTGALSSVLMGGATNDHWLLQNCKVTNTQNNAAARCVHADNFCSVVGCDLYCSGAAHTNVLDADTNLLIDNCRFRGTSTAMLVNVESGTASRSLFYGNSSSVGIAWGSAAGEKNALRNSFYGIGTGMTFENGVSTYVPRCIGNHVTDCSKWLDNLYSGTANIAVIEERTRIRDVTTPRTGIESISIGEITTDTGGAETDYTDAGSLNFYLISGAPGRATGTPTNLDVGAYQHADAGGGGMLVHPGLSGRLV